jgi:hypothetical protein
MAISAPVILFMLLVVGVPSIARQRFRLRILSIQCSLYDAVKGGLQPTGSTRLVMEYLHELERNATEITLSKGLVFVLTAPRRVDLPPIDAVVLGGRAADRLLLMDCLRAADDAIHDLLVQGSVTGWMSVPGVAIRKAIRKPKTMWIAKSGDIEALSAGRQVEHALHAV